MIENWEWTFINIISFNLHNCLSGRYYYKLCSLHAWELRAVRLEWFFPESQTARWSDGDWIWSWLQELKFNLSVTPPRSMAGRVTRAHGRDTNRLGGEHGGWDWENSPGTQHLAQSWGMERNKKGKKGQRWEIWLTRKRKAMFKCSQARGITARRRNAEWYCTLGSLNSGWTEWGGRVVGKSQDEN